VRAVVVSETGEPALSDVDEPAGASESLRVLACGLCGSDVEKLRPEHAGAVLGHEVVARTSDGRRVALVHHNACGSCEQFAAPTIHPGGFAEHVLADAWVELPSDIDDARGTMVEPLACVLRGIRRVPTGRVLVVGHGFMGHLFAAVLRDRGDEVFVVDRDPRRTGPAPTGLVDTVILAGPGGADIAVDAVRAGGAIVVFADAGSIAAEAIYRQELTIVGVRSASPAMMSEAVALLPRLPVPEPLVLPLGRFAEGLELFRRRETLKVVFVP